MLLVVAVLLHAALPLVRYFRTKKKVMRAIAVINVALGVFSGATAYRVYGHAKEQAGPWGVVIDGRTVRGETELEKTLPDEGTPALAKEDFDKIRPGMTQQEVLAILPSLGCELSAPSPEHQYKVSWRQGTRRVMVVFKGDKVLRKEQSGL
jgi:hypothetical protein